MRRIFSGLIDPLAPADGPPPRRFGAFFRWALAGAWPTVALATLVGLGVGFAEAGGAWVLGWLIDHALASEAEGYFARHWPMLLAVAAFFLLARPLLMWISAAMTSLSLGPNLFPLVITRLNRHTLGHSLGFFDDDFAGRLAQKQVQTSRALAEIVNETVHAITFAVAIVIGAAAVLAQVDWRLAALLGVWILLYAALIRYFLPRIRVRARARAGARAQVTGQLVDTLSNVALVKLFAHVGREERAAERAVSAYRERALDFGELAVAFRGLLMLLGGVLPVMLIGCALWLWQGGAAGAGDIAIAGLLSTRIAQISGWISFTAMGIFAHLGEAEDGMRTLAPAHEITDRPGAIRLGRARGEIRFENVTFRYGKERGGGLEGFDLAIAPGEKVALVGPSGAGKTTALSLLLRLYDVEEGRVLLDGCDVRDLTQNSLRRQIATVRQEAAMFNRSAMENILYGRPEADEAEAVEAAREAEAHEFILELEDVHGRAGYDAHLGERGVKLSGGQRQRIALARAMLKDAPILALDEATSALDSEIEAAIQSSLERLMEGKTVIAIAHRLSTIARMDRIVVMDEGRVVEEGDHASLLARGGRYARFWSRQSGGYIGIEAAE